MVRGSDAHVVAFLTADEIDINLLIINEPIRKLITNGNYILL